MKKKILLVVCCCLIVVTGCGNNKKEEKNKVSTDINTTDASEDKLTLENFRKVMNEHGLTVIDDKNCDEKSLNCIYMAYDDRENRSTAYMFTVYRDEDIATGFWKEDLNNLRDEYTISVKDEKNRKLEYYYGTYGIRTIIHYYGKTTSIEVDNDDSDDKDSLNYVREVLAEFGYTDNNTTTNTSSASSNNTEKTTNISNVNSNNEVSTTDTSNIGTNDDVIKTKDYTVKYGTYIGTVKSGEYTITEEITISKEKMKLATDTCEYAVKDNIIYCKQADAIQIIVTGNNQLSDSSGYCHYTLKD